jgi:prepilin-type N-terminal cleavage/methylation domain-containing protein
MNRSIRNSRNGFTLLELIVAIVLASLLGALLAAVFQKQIVGAYTPVQTLQNSIQTANAMEAICADYDALSTKSASDLSSLAAKVNNFSANYGTYCPTCSGSAATTTVGSLSDGILVTVTNSKGGTAKHVFTVQNY